MSPVALKREHAFKTPSYTTEDTDVPFRTGLVIAAMLVVLCFLTATVTPATIDTTAMSMLVGP